MYSMSEIKAPEDCASLTEIRAEIDRIDREIVAAIGRRRGYVLAAAKFKTTSAAVAAPERVAAMIQTRREWAEQEGLNPSLIEKLYRELIAYFVREEAARWKAESV